MNIAPRVHFHFFAATLAVCLFSANFAAAEVYSTEGPPPSSFTIELWSGLPGGPDSTYLGALGGGPIPVHGKVYANVAVDGSGDGTLTFNNAKLFLDNLNNVFTDLGPLGSTHITMTDVGVSIQGDPIPVDSNDWDLDVIGPPTSLTLALNQGVIDMTDHGGLLLTLLGADPLQLDLDSDPADVGLDDLLGTGLGGIAFEDAISAVLPGTNIDIGASLLEIPGLLYLRLAADFHVALVPEPSSVAMLGAGLIGLAVVGIRRRRRTA